MRDLTLGHVSVAGAFLLGLFAVDAGLASARAADMPAKAPAYKPPAAIAPSWTGFYVGLGIGFRSTETDATVTGFTEPLNNLATVCANVAASGGCVTSEPLNDTGFRFSPYAGFNWQVAPHWVVGIEADLGFASKTTTLIGMSYPWTGHISSLAADTFSVKTAWDASARGRVGFLVVPSVMLYATGGAAWLRVESTSSCNPLVACAPGLLAPATITNTTTKTGWTIGGGIEAMLWSSWIARAEYRYADFGTITNVDTRTPETTTYDLAIKTHTALFGLAYKFGPDSPAAGMPVKAPVYKAPAAMIASWSGVYVGAGVGVRSTLTDANVTGFTNAGVDFLAAVCGPLAAFGGCVTGEPVNDTGFRIAPYAGFNWQVAPQWVVGIEGDVGFASKTTTLNGMHYPTVVLGAISALVPDTFSAKTTWDASARGRIGVLATPSVLLYATGGAAWLHVEATSSCSTNAVAGDCAPGAFAPATITNSKTKLGWTVGGGVEAMLWSNWIARGEYRYADFGTITNVDTRAVGGVARVVTYDLAIKTHTALLGLAYKFDWSRPVVAKY